MGRDLHFGRRDFLRLGAGGVGAVALGSATACAPTGPAGPPTPVDLYSMGIASGLHSPTEIVCWTRSEPLLSAGHDLVLEVATDATMTDLVWTSTHTPSAAADHTVKVKPDGLTTDTVYWYRFREDGGANRLSPVGRARTLPAPGAAVSSLSLAYASCQNYANGFYAAWRHIASQPVDAVLFLGDYIYEAESIHAFGVVRAEPNTTCATLTDYRERYRLYKSDADLQLAHAAHPFVPIWDDHEVHNDYDKLVFVHDPLRAAAAYQAWFEYQPVWPVDGTRTYRDLRWGNLGSIFMLDTRQYRDGHSDGTPLVGPRALGPFEASPERSILGLPQRSWLLDGLDAAQADDVPWKLIGNQVLIAPLRTIDLDTPENRALDPNLVKHAGFYSSSSFDTWDGFPVERDMLLAHLNGNAIENTTFLTGDYHAFWAAGVTPDFDDPSAPIVANDYATGAISSAGGAFNEIFMSGGTGALGFTPGFDYMDLFRNGYGLVEADHSELRVTFYAHDARFLSAVPVPVVRFTQTPGNPIASKQLL